MLSYFKINDPFRLIPLLALVFLLKTPTLLTPVTYPNITPWFVIGEAMQGGNTLYVDIWDGIAPFSATIYMMITWLFDRSITSLLVLGTLLTFIQAIIINDFSIRAKLFESNSYLPALIYILITSSHPAFFTLSPVLMGLTFILLGLGKLLSHVEFRAKQDLHIIMIGLFFGSASLFYFPFILIIPISLVLLALFSSTMLRRYFLLLFASFTPLFIAFFYYWIKSDHSVYFINNFILFNRSEAYYTAIGWLTGFQILDFALFFMLVGIISFGKQRRLNNYQNRIVQLFFVLGFLLLFTLLLEKPTTPYSLVIFTPIAAFFTVHLVSLFKKRFFTLLLGISLFTLPTFLLFSISNSWIPAINTTPNTSHIDNFRSLVKGKRIMVLGSAKDLYLEAQLAGPFYDWGLSKSFFAELDYYDNLVFLQEQIENSKPDIIIDLENNWDAVSSRLPLVAKRYYSSKPNVWVRKY